jgi:hypothetical protein
MTNLKLFVRYACRAVRALLQQTYHVAVNGTLGLILSKLGSLQLFSDDHDPFKSESHGVASEPQSDRTLEVDSKQTWAKTASRSLHSNCATPFDGINGI